jgi:hypothetical protein
MRLQRRLEQVYDEVNRGHYGGRLPEDLEIRIYKMRLAGRWVLHMDDTHAIWVSDDLPEFAACITLVHEVVHVRCHQMGWTDHETHGPSFLKERKRLRDRGVFDRWL